MIQIMKTKTLTVNCFPVQSFVTYIEFVTFGINGFDWAKYQLSNSSVM